jgi:hypothetical protein
VNRVNINNLGIPPLAGICSYEDACKIGFDIDTNVDYLKRYNYIKKWMVDIYSAHLTHTPEWEIKCAFSLYNWLEAEHSANLRKRVSEMREPPHGLDKCPDDDLKLLMEELIRSNNTIELLTGIYKVVKPEMIRCLSSHIEQTNPLADHPTYRMLKNILQEELEMQAWGNEALGAILQTDEDQLIAKEWANHLHYILNKAGGIHGVKSVEDGNDPITMVPRYDGERYKMDLMPKRDSRFNDIYNRSAIIDDYYRDEALELDERVFALYYKRLREMDVPEWMGPIIYQTQGKPWEYYHDLSRQLWDEARHAMLGEVGLYSCGVEFYKYPIDIKTSVSLNLEFEPFAAHIILWAIEQSLMNKEIGKRKEWLIAKDSEIPLGKMIQDYDWADEVLHAQIGRKWLLPEFSGLNEMNKFAEVSMAKWSEVLQESLHLSENKSWWPEFVAEMRKSRDRQEPELQKV